MRSTIATETGTTRITRTLESSTGRARNQTTQGLTSKAAA